MDFFLDDEDPPAYGGGSGGRKGGGAKGKRRRASMVGEPRTEGDGDDGTAERMMHKAEVSFVWYF